MNTEKHEFTVIASEEEIQNLNTLLNLIYDEKEDKEIRKKVMDAKNISGQLVNQFEYLDPASQYYKHLIAS